MVVNLADGAPPPSVLLTVDSESHVATLTLNRPEALNAISRQLAADLPSPIERTSG
jgi:enoyl-CoA hydratase/carnithine racemase